MFIYLQISKLLQSSNSYIIAVQYQKQYSKLPNISIVIHVISIYIYIYIVAIKYWFKY